jgi:hypothetical protein
MVVLEHRRPEVVLERRRLALRLLVGRRPAVALERPLVGRRLVVVLERPLVGRRLAVALEHRRL